MGFYHHSLRHADDLCAPVNDCMKDSMEILEWETFPQNLILDLTNKSFKTYESWGLIYYGSIADFFGYILNS